MQSYKKGSGVAFVTPYFLKSEILALNQGRNQNIILQI